MDQVKLERHSAIRQVRAWKSDRPFLLSTQQTPQTKRPASLAQQQRKSRLHFYHWRMSVGRSHAKIKTTFYGPICLVSTTPQLTGQSKGNPSYLLDIS
ncbi:hypothetical protein, partial [uncultured Caballeronia sp.]|uniref:hypothetical protein n=1 Tax=uncultured Caballeronia sp. TaxID=1827198 RepID=UPI0035C9AEF0